MPPSTHLRSSRQRPAPLVWAPLQEAGSSSAPDHLTPHGPSTAPSTTGSWRVGAGRTCGGAGEGGEGGGAGEHKLLGMILRQMNRVGSAIT